MKRVNIRSDFMIRASGLLVTAGFLAWSATHMAGLVWHVLAPDSELSASGVLVERGALSMQRSSAARLFDLDRLQAVYTFSPMGQMSGTTAETETETQATDTRLALTLKGAVLSSDESRSRAIIATADTQDVYKTGESLLNTPGTVVLRAIHQNYVLLDNNGRIETLRMDERGESGAPSAVMVHMNTVVPENTMVSLPPGLNRNSELTDLLRIQAVFEAADSPRAGALRGLQIRHGSRQDFLSAVGLRQGDVITAIDGKQLDSAENLPAMMLQLSTQQSISLQVLRDDTLLTVELDRSRWQS